MGLKINIDWVKIARAIKEFFIALGRGELLTDRKSTRLNSSHVT